MIDILSLVTDESIKYLPKLNEFTGNKEATIFLLRVIHWWNWSRRQGKTNFWKFNAPCSHPDYREGDSWSEELGLSRRELEGAIDRVGTRVAKGYNPATLKADDPKTCVLYFTNAQRITFYTINEAAVTRLFERAYAIGLKRTNVEIGDYADEQKAHGATVQNEHGATVQNEHDLSLHLLNKQEETLHTSPSTIDALKNGVSGSSKPPPKEKPPAARVAAKNAKDIRRSHHSVGLVSQVLGHWPKKIYWDDIIRLGDPDGSGRNRLEPQKLKDLVQIAASVNCYEGNLSIWLLDWYVNGVPLKHRGQTIENPLADKYRRKGANGTSQTEQPRRLRRPLNADE